MSKIKVAALQIPTAAEKMENLNTVRTYLEKLKEEKPDFEFCRRCSVVLIRLRTSRFMLRKKEDLHGSNFLLMQSNMESI